ncbi:MAG: dipeptide epimerase [Candidatus Omnitrophota bacterium]|jgi:L-alanine-DL-glutamate epimerase-like enolase superfamily enzyme
MKDSVVRRAAASRLTARLTHPFRIALGQHDSLENVLFSLELKDGTRGFGEAAVATHITGETVEATMRSLERAACELAGRDLANYLKISAEYGEKMAANPCALAALETAMMDALTRQWRMPLWKFFGARPKTLKTDITVVLGTASESEEFARRFYAKGLRAFKIKVGNDPEEDFERVLRVRKAAGKSALYLDANQAFDARGMLGFLRRLAQAGCRPEVVEQPVPKADWEGLQKVTRESGVTVLADESAGSLADAVRIVRDRAAHGMNVKLMKFGVFRSREIACLAKAAGLKLMIGCMMESPLAIGAAAHLAAGLGCFDTIDLDTPFFLRDKVMRSPFPSPNGTYDLRTVKAGIGVVPMRSGSR